MLATETSPTQRDGQYSGLSAYKYGFESRIDLIFRCKKKTRNQTTSDAVKFDSVKGNQIGF